MKKSIYTVIVLFLSAGAAGTLSAQVALAQTPTAQVPETRTQVPAAQTQTLTAQAPAAQTAPPRDNISNELEVTRAYTPKVGQAVKLPVEPNMTDTVRLRPEISYRITPTASSTTIDTRPFDPARVSIADFAPPRRLYLRAGAGAPFQTTADLYFTPRMNPGTTFGLFANHRGSYSKIENDLGVKAPATEMYHAVGLWGSKQFGEEGRRTLRGELTYDNRRYRPYGAADMDISALSTTLGFSPEITRRFASSTADAFSLGKVGGKIAYGDNFTNLSRFNFGVELDAGYSHGPRKQADLDFLAKIAYMINPKHGFSIGVRERGAIDITDGDRSASTFTLAPRYLVNIRKFYLAVGFDASWVKNDFFGQNHIAFVPAFDGKWTLAGGRFVPFFTLSSQLLDGSFEALSRRNPFLMAEAGTARTGWSHDFRLGFSGRVGDVFTYKLNTGISALENFHSFDAYQIVAVTPPSLASGFETRAANTITATSTSTVTTTAATSTGIDFGFRTRSRAEVTSTYNASFFPAMFAVGSEDGVMLYAGVELGLHNLGGFSARLAGNINGTVSVSWLKRNTFFPDIPLYEGELELSYFHRDKFRVKAGARLIGDREYRTLYSIATLNGESGPFNSLESGTFRSELGPVVDLSVGAEVRVAPDFWVWIEGRNLANQRLYPYNHYRGLGANVMAGIKTVF